MNRFRTEEENEELKKSFETFPSRHLSSDIRVDIKSDSGIDSQINIRIDKNPTNCTRSTAKPITEEQMKKTLEIFKNLTAQPKIIEIYIHESVDVEKIAFDKIKHDLITPLIKTMCKVPVKTARLIEKNKVLFVVSDNGTKHNFLIPVEFKSGL